MLRARKLYFHYLRFIRRLTQFDGPQLLPFVVVVFSIPFFFVIVMHNENKWLVGNLVVVHNASLQRSVQ